MNTSNAPQGLFGLPDLGDVIDQVTKALPPVVADAVKNTVGVILGPGGDINIGDPQPPGPPPIPVEPDTKEMSTLVKALNTAISALDVVLKLGFLIPDQYEVPLKALQGALKTILGWLD